MCKLWCSPCRSVFYLPKPRPLNYLVQDMFGGPTLVLQGAKVSHLFNLTAVLHVLCCFCMRCVASSQPTLPLHVVCCFSMRFCCFFTRLHTHLALAGKRFNCYYYYYLHGVLYMASSWYLASSCGMLLFQCVKGFRLMGQLQKWCAVL